MDDMSCASQILFKGCLFAIFSSILSFLSILLARSVLVSVGATQLTLTLGANSAASVLESPSTPAFETETEE